MPPELNREVVEPRHFSFAHGPFVSVLRRCHLVRTDGAPRARLLVAIAWVPLCLAALARVLDGRHPAAILFDLSVHVRLLIVIPVLILAERVLEQRCRGAMDQFYAGNFADRSEVDRIVDRAERLRDSRVAELAILALALGVGLSALWGLVGPTGMVTGVAYAGSMSLARIWYGVVALPMVQFLILRWVWHWAIWSYAVMRLSRLQLATIATHPDHAAGLGFLDGPISAFSVFVLAIASMMASAWGTQILSERASMTAFLPSFVAFVLVAAIVACGPLLMYVGVLYRARHRETAKYNGLALEYVRDFHDKWIEHRTDQQLLGTQDIQALNDLGGAYGTLVKARLLLFGVRTIGGIWIAAVIPMLPIAIAAMPIDELVRRVGSVMLGGIPL